MERTPVLCKPDAAACGLVGEVIGGRVGHDPVHGSNSPSPAIREVELFFPDLAV